jgi:acetyl-CoA C-acetyltransferase
MAKNWERSGIKKEDIDLFEINEAFAVVTMAAMKEHNLPHERVNVRGGAVVLGHPIGMSGNRIVITLISALKEKGGHWGQAAICIGGGEALSMIIEMAD